MLTQSPSPRVFDWIQIRLDKLLAAVLRSIFGSRDTFPTLSLSSTQIRASPTIRETNEYFVRSFVFCYWHLAGVFVVFRLIQAIITSKSKGFCGVDLAFGCKQFRENMAKTRRKKICFLFPRQSPI
jgi:hypothetical protein